MMAHYNFLLFVISLQWKLEIRFLGLVFVSLIVSQLLLPNHPMPTSLFSLHILKQNPQSNRHSNSSSSMAEDIPETHLLKHEREMHCCCSSVKYVASRREN
jgi:hypothetical protein